MRGITAAHPVSASPSGPQQVDFDETFTTQTANFAGLRVADGPPDFMEGTAVDPIRLTVTYTDNRRLMGDADHMKAVVRMHKEGTSTLAPPLDEGFEDHVIDLKRHGNTFVGQLDSALVGGGTSLNEVLDYVQTAFQGANGQWDSNEGHNYDFNTLQRIRFP